MEISRCNYFLSTDANQLSNSRTALVALSILPSMLQPSMLIVTDTNANEAEAFQWLLDKKSRSPN
jgi:hypothetical protein